MCVDYLHSKSKNICLSGAFFFQNGNWADRSCDEKHGFICMKQSETEPTGKEVDLDIGCKAVSEVCML